MPRFGKLIGNQGDRHNGRHDGRRKPKERFAPKQPTEKTRHRRSGTHGHTSRIVVGTLRVPTGRMSNLYRGCRLSAHRVCRRHWWPHVRSIKPCRAQKRSRSDQQDLIHQMEANRRKKSARGEESLLGLGADRRIRIVEQRRDQRQGKLSKRTAVWAGRGDKGTLAPLAMSQPMMCMIGSALGTLLIMRGSPVSQRRVGRVLARMRMVRTAAHHHVNRQHRGSQDANQPGHATSRSCHIVCNRSQPGKMPVILNGCDAVL